MTPSGAVLACLGMSMYKFPAFSNSILFVSGNLFSLTILSGVL